MYYFAFTSLELSFFGRAVCHENLQCFVEFLMHFSLLIVVTEYGINDSKYDYKFSVNHVSVNKIRQPGSRLNSIHNVYSSNMTI